jgi:ABC-type branched-subunit amino acid transport system substrate-binding protein
VLDVDPLNPRQARERFAQLLTRPLAAVFTASTTPTLAIREDAAARDVLILHQGLVTARFASGSRVVVHARPPLALRAEALMREARGRGLGRIAVLTSGDEFGKTVRDVVSARGRQLGAPVVLEASFSLDTPDLAGRLRDLVRLAPDAVVLGFQGADLGDLARSVREAGFAGVLLALDDDPGARLAAGVALDGTVLVTEAFVPEPGSPGARFAEAFRKRFGVDPSRYAANAYEAVAVLVKGLEATRDAGGGVPGAGRLRDALLARRAFPSLYGGQVILRDDGVFERPLAVFMVTGGALRFVRYLALEPRPAPG